MIRFISVGMSLLSPYWENLDKEKGNISLIQKDACYVKTEIEQHRGPEAKSIQDLEQTTVRQCLCCGYICVYMYENSLLLQESLASGVGLW